MLANGGDKMEAIQFLDYAIIALLAIILYRLIRKTEAINIIVGIFVIFVISLMAFRFGLNNTGQILKETSEMLIYGLVLIFHPEIRMGLKKIGTWRKNTLEIENKTMNEIEKSIFKLSKEKIGALIIIDNKKLLDSQAENQVILDAECKSQLLETIFMQNTPLHDGALIISDDRIHMAGCKLPLSGKKRDGLGNLGTRHLAGIETAERLDLIAIIVSEETGTVSIANKDGLFKMKTPEMFRDFMSINQ